MIADLLRKGLAWARDFFWIAESGNGETPPAKKQASSSTPAEPKAGRASAPASGSKSSAQRRSAAAKTSTNKRGTGTANRTPSKSGGTAAKTPKAQAPKAQAPKAKTADAKSAAPKPAAAKSTGPGAPDADPAKPGDLSEIKGIGPSIKTKLGQLGIKNFADLAGADADQLAKSLGQRTITRERVRSWIAEAKKRS